MLVSPGAKLRVPAAEDLGRGRVARRRGVRIVARHRLELDARDRRLVGDLRDLRRGGIVDRHPEGHHRRDADVHLAEAHLDRILAENRPLGGLQRARQQGGVRRRRVAQHDAGGAGVAAVVDLDAVQQLVARRGHRVAARVGEEHVGLLHRQHRRRGDRRHRRVGVADQVGVVGQRVVDAGPDRRPWHPGGSTPAAPGVYFLEQK